MKPQDSKNTAHSSSQTAQDVSQTKGADIANESLEDLLARLETTDTREEEETTFNHEKLEKIITRLEKDIADGSWIGKNYHYASTDLKLMPALVEQAKRKYPEMNLKLAMTPEDLCLSIKEAIDAGIPSSKFILNINESGIHFAVLDHRTIGDQTSLILFEPANIDTPISSLLAMRTQIAIQKQKFPNCHSITAEMNIQRSHTECGILSLALAKKLHLESDKLTRIHKDNISGMLCAPGDFLSYDKLDTYLPASFYKHTQSRRRFKDYLQSNPGAENETVNKKQETLSERFKKNLVKVEGKTASVSLYKKRVSEYKSLMM
ncbi:YopJ/AvrA family T3SS effector serine/threonine acetyltransferase [Bartonella sp. B39]